jgi:hypothetical protein
MAKIPDIRGHGRRSFPRAISTPAHAARRFLAGAVMRLLAIAFIWHPGERGTTACAQNPVAPESQLKALYLARFVEFVKWPASSSAVTVGILGKDPFGGALDKVIKVRRAGQVEDLKGCQIIFISKSERANLGTILGSLTGAPILTVGDMEGFARQGGMIGFVTVGDDVRFEINNGPARRAGLEIRAKLQKLSIRVLNP